MRVNRLVGALVAYLALGVLAVTTLSDERIRAVTLLILGLFAFKTWVRRKDVMHPDGEDEIGPTADEPRPAADGELETRVAAK
jgi:hypothetical protein